MSVDLVDPGSRVTGNVNGSCGSWILKFLFFVGSCGVDLGSWNLAHAQVWLAYLSSIVIERNITPDTENRHCTNIFWANRKRKFWDRRNTPSYSAKNAMGITSVKFFLPVLYLL